MRAWSAWPGLVLVGASTACRSSAVPKDAVERELAAVRVDVGAGSPDSLARRAAAELADSEYVAERGTLASPTDARIVARFARRLEPGTGTQPQFETMVENAVVATGRFLLVEDPSAPVIRAGCTGSLGSETLWVLVRGPGGELWVEVVGRAGV